MNKVIKCDPKVLKLVDIILKHLPKFRSWLLIHYTEEVTHIENRKR